MKLLGKVRKHQDSGVSTADALRKLKDTLEMLEKTEKYLDTKIEAQQNIAKQLVKKNKRAALLALKRKKAYEGQISKISGARMTLESQIMAIENANISLETMNAMRVGAESMAKIHGSLTIEKVDRTMEEIRDQMDVANEINEAIASPIGFGEDLDEDELEAELEALEEENLNEELMEGAAAIPTSVPASATPAVVTPAAAAPAVDEEAELRELEASMAI